MKRENMRFKGFKGSWYQIDEMYHNSQRVILWENEQLGDEIPNIITDDMGNILVPAAYEITDIKYLD